MTKQLKNT